MKLDISLLNIKTQRTTTLNDMLVACRGNQTKVGRLIGVHRNTVESKIKLGLNPLIIVNITDDGDIKFSIDWGNRGRVGANKIKYD